VEELEEGGNHTLEFPHVSPYESGSAFAMSSR
jgi:hypothetical protein